MATSTATIRLPDISAYPNTIARPEIAVVWSGGTGPYDVAYIWDDDPAFGNAYGNQQTASNTGVSGTSDNAAPASDLGDLSDGHSWYLKVTVTDTADMGAASDTGQLDLWDPINANRYLTDHSHVGVGFDPTDTPGAGWGPAAGSGPADGYTMDFDRYLYDLSYVDSTTPTPHIWYVFPSFGQEGWEFRIIGWGFGDSEAALSGEVLLNALGCSVISWQKIADTGASPKTIDPITDTATPQHHEIRAVVPAGAASGLVYVQTDA